jgi:sulfite reductase (NADPH) flavoprotein alpha-component
MSTELNKPLYNAKAPFFALHPINHKLTGPSSEKETRHHEISLAGSGLTYEVGDALALKPTNEPALVELTIQALRAKGDETVKVKEVEKPLREALLRDYQIHFIDKKTLTAFAAKGATQIAELLKPENAAALTAYTSARNASRDNIDLLNEHPEITFTPQEFCDTLRALTIRLYSISSSLKAHPESVHLTVATVRWTSHGRARGGVCSTFLADRWSGDTTAAIFPQTQKHFRLPDDSATPVIMVGPGTGVAPFRAFLEDRQATGATGRNWLFFGDQRREQDFFYREQFEGWQKSGFLTRLDLAFSATKPRKSMSSTAWKNKVRSFGNGSRKAPTSTSAATKTAWPPTCIAPSSPSPKNTAESPPRKPRHSSKKSS